MPSKLAFHHPNVFRLALPKQPIPNQRWICILATVPQETPGYYTEHEMKCVALRQTYPPEESSEVETKIAQMLKEFVPIKTYGWYGGGYDNIHDYKLIYAVGNTHDIAMEQTLFQAGLRFECFELSEQLNSSDELENQEISERFAHLNQFLKQTFSEVLLYRICF